MRAFQLHIMPGYGTPTTPSGRTVLHGTRHSPLFTDKKATISLHKSSTQFRVWSKLGAVTARKINHDSADYLEATIDLPSSPSERRAFEAGVSFISSEQIVVGCEILLHCGRKMASAYEYPSQFLKKRAAGNTEVKRGEAILISMVDYRQEGKKRSGASADMGRLETLFTTLCFDVHKYVDKEARGLMKTVENLSATKREETLDCFVCFVSAHGNTDERGHYIEAIDDNKVYTYDILKPLMTCGALEGIPKVFFIDACRGEYSKSQNRSRESVVDYMKTVGKNSLVVFSTEEGNESWRDPKSGTLFVQALCDVISLKHEKEDVIAMATMANKLLCKNPTGTKKKPKYQVAQIHFNLTGKLFWRTQDPSESSNDQAKTVGNVIVGQDPHRKKLRNWLLSRETKGTSVAGGLKSQSYVISGTGGIGKTTLAKSLFEDEYINYFFDHRVYWVTLKRNPNIVKRQRQLISKICNEMPSMKLDTQALLLEELKRKLSKMRNIFLILDDVWEKVDVDNLLGDPFLSTLPSGSKCIITSQKPAELEKLDTNIQVEKLDVLSEQDAKKLFCCKAFLSETMPKEQPLRAVVEEVIDACGKLPILLATIGAGQWGIRYIESWEKVRDQLKRISDGSSSDEAVHQKLIEQLGISYDDLPEWEFESGVKISLKDCFLDFAAFAEQEEIEISVLMDLWAKPGLTEDEMYKILEELEQRCLVKMDGYWCRVHDIFRTLAVRIVRAPPLKERERLFAWGMSNSRLPEEWGISQNVGSGDFEDHFETEKMVIAKSEIKAFHPSDVILFRCLTHLRMLFLTSNLNLVSLPPEIGYMKWLEKLDLSWCLSLKRLPGEIGQLESLEKLNMAGCSSLTAIPAEVGNLQKLLELNMQSCGIVELPVEIGQLTRLTYLCLNDCDQLGALPEAMGKLSSLEKLECEMLQIKEIPKALGDLSKLKYVSFAACGAITEIPAEFVKLGKVISFCFAACHRLVTVPNELDQLVTEGSLAVFNVSKSRVVIPDLPPSLRQLQECFEGNSRDAYDEPQVEGHLKMQGLQMRGVLVDPTSVFHPNHKEERRASFGLARIISMVKTEPFLSPRFDTAIRLMYTMANLDGTRHAIVRSGGLPVLLRCIDKGDPKRCGHYAAATLRNICMTYSTHKAVVDAGALLILTRVLNRKNDIRFYAFQALRLVINGDIVEGDYVFTSEIFERCGHSFWGCNSRCIYCEVKQQLENPGVKAGLKS